MSALTVQHYPNTEINMFTKIRVDIHNSFQKRMKDGEKLTHELGVKILKNIQRQSKVKAILTKPIVVLPVTLGAAIAGLVVPTIIGAMSAAVLALSALIYSVACALFVYTFIHAVDGDLKRLSQAYRDESVKATEYLEYLNNAEEINLE